MRATTAAALCLMGCQTYDFEPVEPLGVAQTVKKVTVGVVSLKPNVYLVVDKSGSMDQPLAAGGTRMTAMKAAMGAFLTQAGGAAHLGMTAFPADDTCGPGAVAVPLDVGDEDGARMQSYAARVNGALQALAAKGGTPTGATMKSLGADQALQARDRANFAVLLTDGLPNCNGANDANTCTCTAAGVTPCLSFGSNLCLDDDGSAAELAALKAKGIRTIVVGFGTDVSNPTGAAALAKLAAAGGFTRPCTSDADCNASDACVPGGVDACGRAASTCQQSFFQAQSAAELGRVLDDIKKSFECPPCRQVLNASPTDASMVSVLIDGRPVAPGSDTWEFHPSATAPAVEFLGSTCSQLTASSAASPMHIEIRTVEAL